LSMTDILSFAEYNLFTLITLSVLAFFAGFIDSIAGGGGLIQLPALLIHFPDTNLATLFGTNKIAAFSGTSISAFKYSRKISLNWQVLLPASLISALASFTGAKVVSALDVNILKPLILILLVVIVLYTLLKKDLGSVTTKSLSTSKQTLYASLIGLVIGFYDGFLGPGTGSFLMLGFVVILGFEFVQASAYSKFINCVTNISALVVFVSQRNYLVLIAIIMAISNIAGSLIGTRIAIQRGNGFVRVFFIIIVSFMIIKYGYDVFFR
jgi:uncharacterized membrane protein YfcA